MVLPELDWVLSETTTPSVENPTICADATNEIINITTHAPSEELSNDADENSADAVEDVDERGHETTSELYEPIRKHLLTIPGPNDPPMVWLAYSKKMNNLASRPFKRIQQRMKVGLPVHESPKRLADIKRQKKKANN